MSELKPCPWCGGVLKLLGNVGHYFTSCATCEADGPLCEAADGAVEASNTRAPSPELEALREAARDVAEAAPRHDLPWPLGRCINRLSTILDEQGGKP